MKTRYFLVMLCLIGMLSYGQTDLVVIDRSNIETGSTATGNSSGVSSIGFTRGSGISVSNGGNHTSNGWNANNLASAQAENDYIQWSITALPTVSVTIIDLDIRLRRNTNGPQSWQILYSFDGFTTAGIPLSDQQFSSTTATNYNLGTSAGTNLPFNNPNEGGIITFRLYAWNAASSGGWLRIARNNNWNNLGIDATGARVVGTAVSNSPNSASSDIITDADFNEAENINYVDYNATSDLLPVAPDDPNASLKVGQFILRDGGESPDTDDVPTLLNSITFQIQNPEFIAALAMYSEGSLVEEVTNINDFTTFSNLNGGAGLQADDNSSTNFELYATFTTNVIDNAQIQLTVNSVITPDTDSSLFNTGNAGGAATSVNGDANKIEVNGTSLTFIQNTSDVELFEVMSPFVVLDILDGNSVKDLDFNKSIKIFDPSGNLDSEAITEVTAVNGTATFSHLIFDTEGSNLVFQFFGDTIIGINSDSFNVTQPLTTLAVQDFDGGAPQWNYSNNVPFFDNGWGTDGYYGPIDNTNASPLDFPLFSGNIIGENDLNDEGDNGTTGFARLSFDAIDVSGYTDVQLMFDWQVTDYVANNNDVRYQVTIDGVNQPRVLLFDGNNSPTEGSGREVISIPDGSSTVALYIEVRNNRLTGFSGVDNFKVVASFDGLVFRNGSWYPNAPAADSDTDNVLINSGLYTVNTPIAVNNLTVANGASVNIAAGQSLETAGTLFNNGVITLESTSSTFSSIIPTAVTNEGVIQYSRFTNKTTVGNARGNDLISIPLLPASGQNFNDFINLGSPANSTLIANDGSSYTFGPHNRTTFGYDDYSISSTDALILGTGYRVGTTNGDNLTFEGDINTENTSVEVTKPTGGSKWNLIGNPFPSYVDAQAFLIANQDTFDSNALAIYGYNAGTDSESGSIWTIINFIANNDVNIAPGQAFFISVPNTDGFTDSINFEASMRTKAGGDDFILARSTSPIESLNLQISNSNSNSNRISQFYFSSLTSINLDPGYDAVRFGSNARDRIDVYSVLADGSSNNQMIVQALPMISEETSIVPLGIKAVAGEQVWLSISETTLPFDTEVWLEDKSNNSFTNLRTADYSFTPTQNINSTGRFYLHFGQNALSIRDNTLNNLKVYSTKQKDIIVSGLIESGTYVNIFDLHGREIYKHSLNQSDIEFTINAQDFASGVYIINIDSKGESFTQKLIIN